MQDLTGSPMHVSQILGHLVKRWEQCLPEAVRALAKFNEENNSVLTKTGEEKRALLKNIGLKRFTGKQTGVKIDLSVYNVPDTHKNERA